MACSVDLSESTIIQRRSDCSGLKSQDHLSKESHVQIQTERLWSEKQSHAALPPRIESSLGFLVDVDRSRSGVDVGVQMGEGERKHALESDHSTKGSSRKCPSCQGKKTVPFRCLDTLALVHAGLSRCARCRFSTDPPKLFKEPRACPGPGHYHAMHRE